MSHPSLNPTCVDERTVIVMAHVSRHPAESHFFRMLAAKFVWRQLVASRLPFLTQVSLASCAPCNTSA
jgi:hypothetical protein